MGTSKAGRVLNTKGSERTISEYALVHSNEGTYMNINSKNPSKEPFRLQGGGHGEAMFVVGLLKLGEHLTSLHSFFSKSP